MSNHLKLFLWAACFPFLFASVVSCKSESLACEHQKASSAFDQMHRIDDKHLAIYLPSNIGLTRSSASSNEDDGPVSVSFKNKYLFVDVETSFHGELVSSYDDWYGLDFEEWLKSRISKEEWIVASRQLSAIKKMDGADLFDYLYSEDAVEGDLIYEWLYRYGIGIDYIGKVTHGHFYVASRDSSFKEKILIKWASYGGLGENDIGKIRIYGFSGSRRVIDISVAIKPGYFTDLSAKDFTQNLWRLNHDD